MMEDNWGVVLYTQIVNVKTSELELRESFLRSPMGSITESQLPHMWGSEPDAKQNVR